MLVRCRKPRIPQLKFTPNRRIGFHVDSTTCIRFRTGNPSTINELVGDIEVIVVDFWYVSRARRFDGYLTRC